MTVLLWLVLVSARYVPLAWIAADESFQESMQMGAPGMRVPHWMVGFVIGVLVVASFWQVRTSHAMLLILNWWSASLLTCESACMEAKRRWRRVSGLFRKTSRTFEHCFAALASMILMLALTALYDLRQGD